MKHTKLLSLLLSLTIFYAPSLYAEHKGVTTSGHCPYSCKTEGISKKYCKDWKEGNWCFVEDLRKNSAQVNPNFHKHNISERYPDPYRHACFNKRNIIKPKVKIHSVYPQRGSRDIFRVTGSLEGQCLTEAGVYERSYKVGHINTTNDSNIKKYSFSFVLNGQSNPEVKVYTTNGNPTIYSVDPYSYEPQYSVVHDNRPNNFHLYGSIYGPGYGRLYNHHFYNDRIFGWGVGRSHFRRRPRTSRGMRRPKNPGNRTRGKR